MAALHLALLAALMDRPRRVLAADALYGSTASMLMSILGPLGIETSFVDICNLAAVEAAVEETNPGVILMETVLQSSAPGGRVGQDRAIAKAAGAVWWWTPRSRRRCCCVRWSWARASWCTAPPSIWPAMAMCWAESLIVRPRSIGPALRSLARTLGPVMSPFEAT